MKKEEIVDLLRRSCALKENANLPNGQIVEYLPVMDRLLEDPILTNKLVVEMFQGFDSQLKIQKDAKVILSYEDDQLFGFMTAAVAWCRFLYASKKDDGATFERGFVMNKNEGLVLAIPVLSDKEQVDALVELANKAEAKVLAIVSLANYLPKDALSIPISSLL